MGDRATVAIYGGGKKPQGVEIYTHWGGQDELVRAVVRAIVDVPGRILDGPYFARLVFCRLVEGDLLGGTGYGIWTIGSQENEYEKFSVDCRNGIISIGEKKFTPLEFVEWAKGEKLVEA